MKVLLVALCICYISTCYSQDSNNNEIDYIDYYDAYLNGIQLVRKLEFLDVSDVDSLVIPGSINEQLKNLYYIIKEIDAVKFSYQKSIAKSEGLVNKIKAHCKDNEDPSICEDETMNTLVALESLGLATGIAFLPVIAIGTMK